ncbi:MAG: class I tRNA ligase family protein [Mycoplasmoidaceae bacterium]|nr:class I tRNA ligase family protein [Mycoplasmoidaceae bacterium]
MSKSLGNIINPYDVINRFGVDAFRYFIVRQISIEKDGVFSEEQFIETYNSHLANNYGNMATRLAGMLQKYCDNVVPPLHEEALTEKDKAVKQAQEKLVASSVEYIENFNINGLLNAIQAQYDVLNKYIEDTKP